MSSEIDVPRAARLVRDFVNTHELQIDREDLRSPETLRDWFAEQDLLPADAELEPADLTTAVTVREGLRAVLLSHAGHTADPAALAALDAYLAAHPELPVDVRRKVLQSRDELERTVRIREAAARGER